MWQKLAATLGINYYYWFDDQECAINTVQKVYQLDFGIFNTFASTFMMLLLQILDARTFLQPAGFFSTERN